MIRPLSILFGCSHRRATFPQGKDGKDCHITCLDCGREFAYNWRTMRAGAEIVRRSRGTGSDGRPSTPEGYLAPRASEVRSQYAGATATRERDRLPDRAGRELSGASN